MEGELIRNIRKIAKMHPDRTGDAMYQEGEIEMTESKKRCPVSPLPAPKGVVPGTLRASGTVHEPEVRNKTVTVTLSYGGPGSGAEAYAVVQHETTWFFHTTGQDHYLSSVLNESRTSMNARLARRLNFNNIKL